jgi:outer membrane protein TolC
MPIEQQHQMPGRRIYGALLAAALLTGCSAPATPVLQDISDVTGLKGAVAFRQSPDEASTTDATLSTEQFVRRAVVHSPQLQAALARVRQAQADAHQARLLPNPVLSLDLRFPEGGGPNRAFEATVTGDVMALLQMPAKISGADKRLRVSAAEAVTAALDVMAEAQQTYLAAESTDAEINQAQERHKTLQQLRDIAQKRLDAGDVARLDVLTLDGELLSADIDMADLKMERTEGRLTLARLMGTPRAELTWQLAAWELPEEATLNATTAPGESAWIDTALKKRSEIQSQLWELSALGDDLTAAEFSPFVGGEMGVHTEHDPDWRTGPTITIPIPIFDFGQAAREKIEAQRMEARHTLKQREEEIIGEVRLAYAGYISARDLYAEANGKLLPLHQRILDQSRTAYQAGEADLATLLLAESDLRETRTKVLELREKLLVARVKLQRAAGGAAIAAAIENPGETPATSTAPTSRPATGNAP